MKRQWLQVVDLGSTLSRVVHIDDEVNARIAKASAAFGWLCRSILDRSGIGLDTKLKVYRSVVLPTLLYACETWTVYQSHAKRLNHFLSSCFRKLLKIKWQDRIPDSPERQGCSVHTLLILAQLRWTGHVIRMPDQCLPNKILYGELQECIMNDCQRKSSMESFKLENAPMEVRRSNTRTPSKPPLKTSTYQQSWEQIARGWTKWQGLIGRDAGEYEAKGTSKAKQKHAQRKARANASPTVLSSSDLSFYLQEAA